MGKLYAVGFGPGGYEHMTAKAIDVIKNADIITGYTTYVEMLKEVFPRERVRGNTDDKGDGSLPYGS